MRKRMLSLLLALIMVLSLTACGGNMMVGITVTDDVDGAVDAVLPGDEGSIEAVPDYDDAGGYEGDVEYTDDIVPEDGPAADVTADDAPEMEGDWDDSDYYIDEAGWYYSAEDVAEYLVTYGYLPGNFITKNEARDLGWNGGSVEDYAGKGYAIGGDKFGNREGLLPKEKGRQYYECDIDTNGLGERGAERLVFSNDGLIYYTPDHYETFELLYGEE